MTFDPDAPWQINVLLLILLGGLNLAGIIGASWLTNRRTSRRVRAIAKSAAVTEWQTANTHDTNLREDIDRILAHLSAQRADIGEVHGEMRDARKDIIGIRADARRDRREIGRLRKQVQEHIDQSPAECGALPVKGDADA